MTQFYLVRISKMMTSKEGVTDMEISFVVSRENMIEKLEFETIAEALDEGTKGVPLTDLRPMTEDEVRDWREDNDRT